MRNQVFRNIGITGNFNSKTACETLVRLQHYLARRSYTLFLDKERGLFNVHEASNRCTKRDMAQQCDLVIVIGGDGNFLSTARVLAGSQVPVIGINRGALGFLTDIAPKNLEHDLEQVLNGAYTVEERFLLKVSILNDTGQKEALAMNEVVLHPNRFAQMIEFELFIDDIFVFSQKSDGMIFSTPTGSTAYALSAGGPIMHPNLAAIALIPMYPHTLSNRPMVISDQSDLMIKISRADIESTQLSCDGHIFLDLMESESIYIKKDARKLLLLHPLQYTYYQACREKLGWAHRLTHNE